MEKKNANEDEFPDEHIISGKVAKGVQWISHLGLHTEQGPRLLTELDVGSVGVVASKEVEAE